MALSKTTQDHDEIQQWAEKRGGKPAEVASTERNGQTGILRIEFPGAPHANDSALKEISWDEFFEKFDASGLSLVYQEVTKEGAESNFNKLIHPENASASAKKSAGRGSVSTKSSNKTAATKTSAAKSSAAPVKKSASAPAKKSSAAPAKKSSPAPGRTSAGKSASAKSAAGKSAGTKSAAKTASKKSAPTAKTSSSKAVPAKKTAKKAPTKKAR